MIKWIPRILLGIIILVVLFLIGANWILREAFGPKTKTVEIKLDSDGTLICNETYNADMAAVFYDVDFKLETTDNEYFELGSGSFF